MDTKQILRQLISEIKTNHLENILSHVSLKNAHIYCKINRLPGQISGSLLEHYICKKYNMSKNKASDSNGDLKINNLNIEVKSSLGGVCCNKFNYVQIRANHMIDYYLLTAYYLATCNVDEFGGLFVFKISKEDMKYFIMKYGSYSHGTVKKLGKITMEDLNDISNNNEYSIRPVFDSKLWKELQRFRSTELKF